MDVLTASLVIGLGIIGLHVLYKYIAGEEITSCVSAPFLVGGAFVVLYLLAGAE